MKGKLYELLESLGYEVYEQGSFTDSNEYPEHFFTIFNDDTIPYYYDNEEFQCVWVFEINFYSISPTKTVNVLLKAKELLQKNKWIISGKGHDVFTASKNHSGRTIEAKYIEKIKEKI